MSDLISVIVPIYNSELYLMECIKSVLEQSYTCFELILVNDGSCDNSKEFCQRMCEEDERIRFFHQKHGGASSARNTGIQAAEGKYLFFLDSDDLIHRQLLESLYKAIKETKAAIAAEKYFYIEDGQAYTQLNQKKEADNSCRYTFLESDKVLNCFTSGEPSSIASVLYGIGGKMICRETLENLMFDTTLSNGEDTKLMYQMLTQGADVVILHQNWYVYRQHNRNLSRCSVKSCESMYRCQKYMMAWEYRSGRIEGAVFLEKYLLSRMVDWYVDSRKTGVKELSKYLKKMSIKEKKLKIFSRVEFNEKLKFKLAFNCFSIYWLIHKVVEWRNKISGCKKQERNYL